MKQMQKQTGKAYLEARPKVMSCTCLHDFQDKTYGKGKRLHNPFAKGWRCTVCGNEKENK